MNANPLTLEIWHRLRHGKPLDGLPLETKEGRLDLSGFDSPAPDVVRQYETSLASVVERDKSAHIRGARWENIDFTGAKLEGLRVFDCEIHNCRFDGCDFHGLRVWSTTFSDCSFRKANLRRTVLGPMNEGKCNVYSNIDFSGADLRETVYFAAVFTQCNFRKAKLARIDFRGSSFTDCVFEGELNDVLFYHRGLDAEGAPANEMVNIDFSRARLRDVDFRGLVLDKVKLPNDAEHVVIKQFASALDKMIAVLAQQPDDLSKELVSYLEIDREWALPEQAQGVINLRDLADNLGDEAVKRLLAIVPK